MKLGLGLPHLGPLASPVAIRTVATAAEAAGLDSLWAMDRLLSPISPRTRAYPGRSDGALPAAQQTVIDPLVALTIAATVTERVSVGTDVLVAPWYAPILLARSLAALDQASAGRLVVGLGLGWSLDEFEAVGVPMSGRGQRIEEVLDVLDAVWRDETVALSTSHERIAPSVIGAKPVQRPRPPLLLGGRSRAALERIARRADGWLPFGIPLEEVKPSWAFVLELAERAGRDPARLQLVVRADPRVSGRRATSTRAPFSGSCGQVMDDIARLNEVGAHEVILDFHATATSADHLIHAALCLTTHSYVAA